MKANKYRIYTISALILTFAVFLFVFFNKSGSSPYAGLVVPEIEVFAADSEPAEDLEVPAPNGKMTLKLTVKKESEFGNWSILIGNNLIYSKSLPAGESIVIPYNTFSPDNKYLLINEVLNGNFSYKVIRTDGGIFRDGANVLDIGNLFLEKYKDLYITEATGWADTNLVLINTNKTNGDKGPSIWFSVLNKSFIRLSTRFD